MRYAVREAVLLTLLAALTGCGGAGDDDELTVLAAASLSGTFTELEEIFREEHPGVEIHLAFDSSATLANQVVEGAPADVLATADEQTMESAVAAGATDGRPAAFASNRLVLVVPGDNPARVEAMRDLDRGDVDFVVCVPTAPCGRIAAAALDEAGVDAPAASEETDVKAVLSKVMRDEADAGLVYATDAFDAGQSVRSFEVSASPEASTRYLVAALRDARSPALAQDWVDLLMSERGQQVLRDAEFAAP
ncbi:MAG: molybdate ABC transporter substrate-binding protein [Nocardioides sp.]